MCSMKCEGGIKKKGEDVDDSYSFVEEGSEILSAEMSAGALSKFDSSSNCPKFMSSDSRHTSSPSLEIEYPSLKQQQQHHRNDKLEQMCYLLSETKQTVLAGRNRTSVEGSLRECSRDQTKSNYLKLNAERLEDLIHCDSSPRPSTIGSATTAATPMDSPVFNISSPSNASLNYKHDCSNLGGRSVIMNVLESPQMDASDAWNSKPFDEVKGEDPAAECDINEKASQIVSQQLLEAREASANKAAVSIENQYPNLLLGSFETTPSKQRSLSLANHDAALIQQNSFMNGVQGLENSSELTSSQLRYGPLLVGSAPTCIKFHDSCPETGACKLRIQPAHHHHSFNHHQSFWHFGGACTSKQRESCLSPLGTIEHGAKSVHSDCRHPNVSITCSTQTDEIGSVGHEDVASSYGEVKKHCEASKDNFTDFAAAAGVSDLCDYDVTCCDSEWSDQILVEDEVDWNFDCFSREDSSVSEADDCENDNRSKNIMSMKELIVDSVQCGDDAKKKSSTLPPGLPDEETSKDDSHHSQQQQPRTVFLFVYGTLKRGYCNHYNLETDGISYFQEAVTLHPYVLYLDSTNRSRPCLIDGSLCPISQLLSTMSTACKLTKICDGRSNEKCTDDLDSRETKDIRTMHHSDSTSSSPQIASHQRSPRSIVEDAAVCPFCCCREQQWLTTTSNQEDESHLISNDMMMKCNITTTTTMTGKNLISKAWGLPVKGELYEINASLMPAIDKFERVPLHYTRQTISVRGLKENRCFNAEVYFNNTTYSRWIELLDGRFRCINDYTMDHHKSYKPRKGNELGFRQQRTIQSIISQSN